MSDLFNKNTHDEHVMHTNSLEAYANSANALKGRKREVFDTIVDHGPITDRGVLAILYPNSDNSVLVQPRISDLMKEGLLKEVGSVVDPFTGKHCRKVAVWTYEGTG